MTDTPDELAALRDDIDRIDEEIATLIGDRVDLAADVARVKSEAGTDLVDETREEAVASHYEALFEERDLGGENGRDLAAFLIEVALERETAVAGDS